MTTKVQKWGNSLAIRLPKEVAESVGLRQGSIVSIVSSNNLISIKPLSKSKATISELVSKIRTKNRHALIDWGKPKGRELW